MGLQEKLKNFQEILAQTASEQQQTKLNELLSTLDPEELEQLQQQQCIICAIAQGKVPSSTVYEDDKIKAVLDINPASNGHVIVFPKQHASVLAMVPDEIIGHLFIMANKIMQAQFEALKPAGTNLHVANGAEAGQTAPHVVLNLIPRYKDDGLQFEWEYKKIPKEELPAIAESIKEKLTVPELMHLEKKEEVKTPQLVVEEEEEFYRIP